MTKIPSDRLSTEKGRHERVKMYYILEYIHIVLLISFDLVYPVFSLNILFFIYFFFFIIILIF